VLGATHWEAPVWIGLPVQWCGLVYADAIRRLARHDPQDGERWRRLADGIAASGVQQTWPVGSDPTRQGLLPDSFAPRPQIRNDVAINPGTTQAPAAPLLTDGPAAVLYDFHVFRRNDGGAIIVHAPGAITDTRDAAGTLTFTVRGWPREPYHVLVSGLEARPTRVRVNGDDAPPAAIEHAASDGWLVLRLENTATVVVETAP
jgi:hypothetical protein